jgi:hypothetical protein
MIDTGCRVELLFVHAISRHPILRHFRVALSLFVFDLEKSASCTFSHSPDPAPMNRALCA